jgi:hypothetical protein
MIGSASNSSIEILVIPAGQGERPSGDKGLGTLSGDKGIADLFRAPVKLNVDLISENLRRFVVSMNSMMANLPAIGAPFRLEEIELSVELNAEGNFQLIGGAKLGVTGGLKLTMKRTS